MRFSAPFAVTLLSLSLSLAVAAPVHAAPWLLPAAAPADRDALTTALFKEAATASLSAPQWVRLDADVVVPSTSVLEFQLDGKPVSASRQHVEVLPDGTTLWSGAFTGSAGESGSIELVHSPVGVSGIIKGTALYRLLPAGQGLHLLSRDDRLASQPLHPPRPLPHAARPLRRDEAITAATQEASVIRVIALTSQARYQSAGARLRDQILLGIAEANTSYRNSNINARLELAGFEPVAYRESASLGGVLQAFRNPRTAESVAARRLRDGVKADVVLLAMGGGYYCGVAPVGTGAEDAFMVVRPGCLSGNDTVPHELGHIAGASHDRETSGGGGALKPWAYGYRNCSLGRRSWHTVMAYPCAGGSVRIQKWSSPLVLHEGAPTGSAARADNRRVMEENRARLAAFR